MKRINLLPKLKQRELEYERTLYGITVAVIIATAILLLGILVQVGVWSYLNRKVSVSETEIESLKKLANKTENAEVKDQIKQVNSQIIDFTNLSGKTPEWSAVLSAFVKNVPEGVKITRFEADIATREIDIGGFSPSRDLVIDLYNNINADKDHFKDINYPLENVTQPTNVRFIFTFSIADGLLIKGEPPFVKPEEAPKEPVRR